MERKIRRYSEQEAYIKLSALCAAAEYCVHDMRKKMKDWILSPSKPKRTKGDEGDEAEEDKSVSNDCKDKVLRRLVEEKFIDEKRFAHAFVRDKFRYNKWGRVRISQELKMRHIDTNVIEDALTEIEDDDNLDTLRALIAKKRPTVKGKSEYEIRGKLIRFAIGRGFSMDEATKVIGDLDEA